MPGKGDTYGLMKAREVNAFNRLKKVLEKKKKNKIK